MRFLKSGLIFCAFCLFIFACTQPPADGGSKTIVRNSAETQTSANSSSASDSSSADSELAAARKIYAEKCVACHKENGEGGKVSIEGAEFKVPNYKSERAKNKTDAKLLDYIENGEEEMPSFKGKLSPEEIKSLVKLIRRDFQGK